MTVLGNKKAGIYSCRPGRPEPSSRKRSIWQRRIKGRHGRAMLLSPSVRGRMVMTVEGYLTAKPGQLPTVIGHHSTDQQQPAFPGLFLWSTVKARRYFTCRMIDRQPPQVAGAETDRVRTRPRPVMQIKKMLA